jgi:hypothetical protein
MKTGPEKELPVIACTLSSGELEERRRRWRDLIERALTGRVETAEGVRLLFSPRPGVERELRELAELERACCAFAGFDVIASRDRVVFEASAPPDGVSAVREIFG